MTYPPIEALLNDRLIIEGLSLLRFTVKQGKAFLIFEWFLGLLLFHFSYSKFWSIKKSRVLSASGLAENIIISWSSSSSNSASLKPFCFYALTVFASEEKQRKMVYQRRLLFWPWPNLNPSFVNHFVYLVSLPFCLNSGLQMLLQKAKFSVVKLLKLTLNCFSKRLW